MKLLVVGDTHGSRSEVRRVFRRAVEQGAEAIVQVGDFGFWEHEYAGIEFLDAFSRDAHDLDIPVYWVDGNHENHTMLRAEYGPGGHKHNPTSEGFWRIRPNLFYIPRGTKWEWDGVTLMGVGGAVSIDKNYRLDVERKTMNPRSLWWPEEQITDEELEFVKSQGTADILFTHDCPTIAPFRNRLKEDLDSTAHRQKMNEIGRSVQPKFWFHGHMHEFYYYKFPHERGEATVVGLECDGMDANWCYFDTALVDKAIAE